MSTYILTNMFPNGFNKETAKCLKTLIRKRNRFAFVASEFEVRHEVTDHYFQFFLSLFEDIGIHFDKTQVVDGRMTKEEAQNAIREADVVWLSGGDTPTQYHYFETYGLCDDALIVCSEDRTEFYGEVYLLYQGQITTISK